MSGSGPPRRFVPRGVLAAYCLFFGLTAAAAQERLAFVGVALDVETRQADKVLQDYLHRKAGVDFAPEELEYGRVIDRLANWRPEDGHYLARTTPYVYVTAEMLGADFEILATYISRTTGQRTYNAYFVVNRDDFPSQPDHDELFRFLRNRSPARFVYHSRFSTSSYFLPALLFRSHNVFHMPESTESLVAVRSEQVTEGGSTRLVELVARGEADIAAVWDGTKVKFEPGHPGGLRARYGDRVWFVQIPTALPNDLLVCSAGLDDEVKHRLREAIRSMGRDEIDRGDFRTWLDIREATDARLALADLRWSTRERTAPVTVEIRPRRSAEEHPQASALITAARQAVRLSGSEFVLFDQDYHEHIDFRWSVEPIHDGAVVLRSGIPGSGVPEQTFQISYRDVDDLVKRIASIMNSRMHRIRYVWPYSQGPPIVIRDTAYSVPEGSTVKVQRIHWLDPHKNKFRAGPLFDAEIRDAGYYRYRLDEADFPEAERAEFRLDAMSNVSYRVVLVRSNEERPIFRGLTIAFVALLGVAAVGAMIDLWRRPGEPGPRHRIESAPPVAAATLPVNSDRGSPGSGPERKPRHPDPGPWH